MNYQNLLNPIIKAHPITLLGQQIFIRRLTQEELWDYEADLQALEKSDDNARQTSIRGITLFLSALVNEDGSRPAADELPQRLFCQPIREQICWRRSLPYSVMLSAHWKMPKKTNRITPAAHPVCAGRSLG